MSIRERLNKFIHHPVAETSIMVLIVVSVVLLLWEMTVEDVFLRTLLAKLNDGLTVVFVVELLIRYYVSRSKKRFFRQYWIDIVAVIPWMRSLRMLRLLRLLRIFRVGLLLNRRLSTFSKMFRGNTAEYMIILVIIVIIILAGAIGIRIVEGDTNISFTDLDQALWWSAHTMIAGEPIGGEPVTTAGRMVSTFVMLGGLTIFAMFTGIVSAVMVDRLRNIKVRTMDLDELRDHIIICGWNRSGKNMLAELAKSPELFENGLVMVAEFDEEPDLSEYAIDPDKIFIVHDDYTQLSVLKQCGGEHADIALLLADRTKERGSQDTDARTVLAAIAIERMNPNIFSSVELLNRENGAHLKVMGVEEIVVGDEYAGTLIAMGLRNRGISVLIDELMSIEGNGFFKAPIPQSLVGATIIDVSTRLRDDHNAILVAVETRDGQARQVVVNPDSELKLKTGDLIFVISEHSPRLA